MPAKAKKRKKGRANAPQTRSSAEIDTAHFESKLETTNQVEKELNSDRRACSHCGAAVKLSTYTKISPSHYNLWNTAEGRWNNTLNGFPQVPATGYDGVTILADLHTLDAAQREAAQQKKKKRKQPEPTMHSHLLPALHEGEPPDSSGQLDMEQTEIEGPASSEDNSSDEDTDNSSEAEGSCKEVSPEWDGKFHWSEDIGEGDEIVGDIDYEDRAPVEESKDQPEEWQDEKHAEHAENVSDEDNAETETESERPREDREPTDPFWVLMQSWKSTFGMSDAGFDVLVDILKTREGLLPPVIEVPLLPEHAGKTERDQQEATRKRSTPTRHNINAALGLNVDLFESVCVCGECGRLYDADACIRAQGGSKQSRLCCKKPLLRKVGGKTPRWEPVLTYPTVSVEVALEKILRQPGIGKALDEWKKRAKSIGGGGQMSDVTDGQVWKDFQEVKGVPFLSGNGLALMLNMDGFQPFKYRQYSVQGIYLAIMNLPRHLRYKRENMILVGLVPGGKEKIPLAHFLERLVDELQALWDNVSEVIHRRVALLAVACDVPAGRKLLGFISHSSKRGCSRCDCEHETIPKTSGKKGPPKINWGAPVGADDQGNFKPRTRDAHYDAGRKWFKATSDKARSAVSSGTGYRWTPFLRLSYFDPARMLVLDPLHNVWEGMFKDLLKKWVNSPDHKLRALPEKLLTQMEAATKRCRFPRSMGPVLGKIGHKMAKFTGAELKNMLNTFFLWLVDGQESVSSEQFQLVNHLHLASRLLDERVTDEDAISDMEYHLDQYCNLYCKMYGPLALKCNHHLSRHLGGFMRDYGVTAGFWLFNFERYNGVIVNYNSRASTNLESSMFRQYSNHSSLLQSLQLMAISGDTTSTAEPPTYPTMPHKPSLTGKRPTGPGLSALLTRTPTADEKQVALKMFNADTTASYLVEQSLEHAPPELVLRAREIAQQRWDHQTFSDVRGAEPIPGFLFGRWASKFSTEEVSLVRSGLAALHRRKGADFVRPGDFKMASMEKFTSLQLGGVTYGSETDRIAHIIVNNAGSQAGVGTPLHVLYYLSVRVTLASRHKLEAGRVADKKVKGDKKVKAVACDWDAGFTGTRFIFARVQWFKPMATTHKRHFQAWSVNTSPDSADTNYQLMPVLRIVSGCVPLISDDSRTFVCGLLRPHLQF